MRIVLTLADLCAATPQGPFPFSDPSPSVENERTGLVGRDGSWVRIGIDTTLCIGADAEDTAPPG